MLKGIKKLQANAKQPRVCRPITIELTETFPDLTGRKGAKIIIGKTEDDLCPPITAMQGIRSVLRLEPGHYQDVMLWVACCLAFFWVSMELPYKPSTAMTAPPIYHCNTYLAIDSRKKPSVFQFRIKQRQGLNLYLGKAGKDICPVRAMISYPVIRGSRPGPLFLTSSGRMLTQQSFSSSNGSALTKLQLDTESYNTHSFHIGAVTPAIEAGIPETQIKKLERWHSDAYQGYVRTQPEERAKLSK